MSNKLVIYKNNEGGVSILTPVLDSGLTLEQIIEKDVPIGAKYKIIEASELPEDRTFRNAWEFSE